MAWNVTLDGVPTEDATLGYNSNAPMDWAVIGQQWQVSADGIAWTDISGATQETFIPGDAEAGMSLRVVVLYEDQLGGGQTASSDGQGVVNVNDPPQGDVTIMGMAKQGETLFAVDAVADDDGTQNAAFSYRWQVETAPGAWADIADATEVFFNLTQAEVGRAVRAVVSYTDDQGTLETVASAPTSAVQDTNDAPNGGVTLTGSAQQGQTLGLVDGVTDADGVAAGARTYKWQVESSPGAWADIAGANGATFTLTQAEVGRAVRAVLSYTDDLGTTETVESDPTLAVENIDDEPGGTLAIVGTAKQGQVLSLADAVTDADGISDPDRGYEWQVADGDGGWTSIPGATGATFALTQAEVGRAVRMLISYQDDYGSQEWVASAPTLAVENVNDAPGGTLTVVGTAKQGETLVLVRAVTDADGIPAQGVTHRWQVESTPGTWTDIPGATGAAFAPTQAEVGRAVRAVVSYTDGQGTAETVASAPTLAVENVNDGPQGAIIVTGTARQGQLLTVAGGVTDADGHQAANGSYKWQVADGNGGWADIDGATGATFMLTQAEVGRAVRAVLSYTDDLGAAETVSSAPTAAVGNLNGAPFGALTVVGAAKQGETLSLVDLVNDEDGAPSDGRSYKWQVADGDGGWADIPGAADETFALTQAEVGRAVRAVVRYTDGGGTPEEFASAATAAVENVDDAPTGAPVLREGPGGAPVEGVPVTVDVSGVTDADGLGAFAFVWSREGAAAGTWAVIDGADGASYTPGDADVGGRLKVEAGYTDGGGTAERFESVTAFAVANVNDAPTGAVALSGRTVRGETATASASPLADADGIGPVSLRWERADGNGGWTPIAGVTAAAYTFEQADVGHVLRVVATWTDGHGTAETVAAETGVVAARAIMLPPPESGETEQDSAADEWTSTDLAGMIADGGSFAPPAGVESVRLADGVLSFGTGTAEAFIARLYLGLLGREGDLEGVAHAGQGLEDGASRADLARMFLASGEYGARHGEQTNAGFVEGLYTAFLGRGGDASERGFWTDALDGGVSRAEIAAAIAGSGEAAGHMQASTTGVFVADVEGIQARSLYHCALGREADAPGLLHWSNVLEQGIDLRTLGDVFDDSAEFGARHGASSDEAFVESLYRDGAGRGADAAGLDFWVGLLASGAMGRGEVALRFSMTQEARNDLDWAL